MLAESDFRRVLAESQLTKSELALLYGVTRQALHYWAKTSLPTGHGIIARMVEVVTRALCNAIDRGILPLAAMSRPERRAKIAHMAKTLQNLKPAPVQ